MDVSRRPHVGLGCHPTGAKLDKPAVVRRGANLDREAAGLVDVAQVRGADA
jgi:hypothetical protein